jgi:hypothetical protein
VNWKDEVRTAFGDHEVDEGVVEELAEHASLAYQRLVADAVEPTEAKRRIRQSVADWTRDPALHRRRGRFDAVEPPPLESSSRVAGLAREIRYACRVLRRQPGYAAVAVLTIGLGVGATTALFSLAYGVLFKPLPWPDAGRIVRLYETRQGATNRLGSIMTSASYVAWRERPSTIDGLAAWAADRCRWRPTANLCAFASRMPPPACSRCSVCHRSSARLTPNVTRR